MKMNHIRYGHGRQLLLIHGLGGSWRSWTPVLAGLASHREVIAIDLPGFGKTPPLKGEVTIAALADAVTAFLDTHGLRGIDAVGSSMGARLVLELVRRGNILGNVVSLNPGGFWQGWQTHFFYVSIALSIRLIRILHALNLLRVLTGNNLSKRLLFTQFSARPLQLTAGLAFHELTNYVSSPSFDELLYNLAYGEKQLGMNRGVVMDKLVIGWGRQDWICFASESKMALQLFPDACLYWFEDCGHFPQWDQPEETINLILRSTEVVSAASKLPGEINILKDSIPDRE